MSARRQVRLALDRVRVAVSLKQGVDVPLTNVQFSPEEAQALKRQFDVNAYHGVPPHVDFDPENNALDADTRPGVGSPAWKAQDLMDRTQQGSSDPSAATGEWSPGAGDGSTSQSGPATRRDLQRRQQDPNATDVYGRQPRQRGFPGQ